jgi:O-antigen/teichoic acid export membrane protein
VVRLATVVLTLLTLRFLAHRMGAADYSVYIIVIQLIAWPASIGLLGMGISVPRTIAAHSSNWSPESVLVSAACLAAVTLLLPLVVVGFASPEVSAFVLRDRHWAPAVATGALYLATLAPLQLLLYYLIGLKHFQWYVAMELVQSGLIPVSIAILDPASAHVESFLLHYSVANIGLFAIALGLVLNSRRRAAVAKLDFTPKWAAAKELLNVGTPKLISGLYFTLTVSSFPVALRWSGAGLEQTAAASLGLAIAITLSRLAITANALVGFMQLASDATSNRRALVAPVRRMLTFALAGGFTFAVFSAVAIDLAVRVLIGPAYERQHLFLVLGAMFGSLQLVGYVVEIPMDAFAPAWRKAAASLIFAAVLATVIALGIATGVLDAVGVVVAYWSIFAAFCVVLYLLVQRAFDEPIRPDPVLLIYLGCCSAVAISLVVARASLPNVLVQVVACGVAVALILTLMAFFGLFKVGIARGAAVEVQGE